MPTTAATGLPLPFVRLCGVTVSHVSYVCACAVLMCVVMSMCAGLPSGLGAKALTVLVLNARIRGHVHVCAGLPSGLAAKALPIRRPAMGTWLAPSDPSDCVLCQSSDCNKQTGPLAWVGHAGVCACLAVPLMPERQPPTWSGNAAANTVGTAGSNAAAAAAAGSGSQAAAAAGLAAPLAAAAAHSAATASSAAAPGAPTAPAAAAAGSGSNGSSGSEGSSSDNTLLAWDLLKWRVRTHGPCMSTVDYQPGCHVHTCGHMMHVKCAARYR